MDPITHVLLGASLGYAAFGRKLGRHAALAGGLGAFVPDADVFIHSASDPLLAIEYHRHFTHSLFFAPVGAILCASLWMLIPRWRPHLPTLWLCCLAGYASHCLLDSATSYGTQLLWPLTRMRVGWDWISIIDPIFTLSLLAGCCVAMIRKSPRPALLGLALTACYMVLGNVQHERAVAAQAALAATRQHTIERFEVMPTMANNVVWRTLYLHDGRIYSDRVRIGWFSGATVAEGLSLPVIEEKDLTASEKLRDQPHRPFSRFTWFSEGWVARSPADATVIGDMRYSLSAGAFDPIWGIRFTPAGAPTDVEWINNSRNRRPAIRELWAEIRGHSPQYHPVDRR
ncbi:MAG TPA: metal-dependent hydrolase [Roseimicrobium sp.]|nr:metal-dependent hydrolase [Roseimicrobium sp.]